jgi:hypothetical protein
MANNPDYIPPADDKFHEWVCPTTDYIVANATAMGLTPDDTKPLTDAVATWKNAWPAHQSAQAAATGAKTTKDNSRADVEAAIRPLVQQLQVSPKVTDQQRSDMNITVRSTTRTRVSVPVSCPVGTVDTSQRLQHIISYRDDTTTKTRGKPAGVSGCEIWEKIGGPAPTDISQLTYLGMATRSPFLAQFTGAQAGQTAYYWLRWVNTRNEKGPWSEPVSATIAG